VVDRRRLELWDRRTPLQAYHAAKSQTLGKAEEIVQRAARAAAVMAERAVRGFVDDVGADGHRVESAGVVLGTRGLPQSLPPTGISHAGAHFAEGEMYRSALLDALETCGLEVTGVREKDIERQAGEVLRITDPVDRVTELGRVLGPPWTKDHKHAALLAWMALAKR
jgi:hypothetical protein